MILNPLTSKLLAAATLAAVCFGAGFAVQGWRMKSAAADAMSTAVAKYHDLELKVERQNSGVALLQYQLDVSKDIQTQAEIRAGKLLTKLGTQTKSVISIQADNCTDMVNKLHEVTR